MTAKKKTGSVQFVDCGDPRVYRDDWIDRVFFVAPFLVAFAIVFLGIAVVANSYTIKTINARVKALEALHNTILPHDYGDREPAVFISRCEKHRSDYSDDMKAYNWVCVGCGEHHSGGSTDPEKQKPICSKCKAALERGKQVEPETYCPVCENHIIPCPGVSPTTLDEKEYANQNAYRSTHPRVKKFCEKHKACEPKPDAAPRDYLPQNPAEGDLVIKYFHNGQWRNFVDESEKKP